MKYIVVARTTDGSDPIEKEISQALETERAAESFIEGCYRDHPELLEHERLIPGRKMEIAIKTSEG